MFIICNCMNMCRPFLLLFCVNKLIKNDLIKKKDNSGAVSQHLCVYVLDLWTMYIIVRLQVFDQISTEWFCINSLAEETLIWMATPSLSNEQPMRYGHLSKVLQNQESFGNRYSTTVWYDLCSEQRIVKIILMKAYAAHVSTFGQKNYKDCVHLKIKKK